MSVIGVWAPNAKQVEVRVGDAWTSMDREESGWWSADVPAAKPGVDYAFRVDGGGELPDPRSPWQPHGVHGPSRLVDHDAFPWTDGYWQSKPLSSAIIYELHVGTFTETGTFDAATSRLDHLVDLGITHINVMPVNEFAGDRGWGYDGVQVYAPHHAYGGPDGLKRLVDACHGKGLGVILDVVYNHFGPEGCSIAEFGPYFSSHYSTPWGAAVNLAEPLCDEVRRFIIDSALAWFRDYHVDGLRVDGVHAFIDTSAVHLMEQLAAEVETLSARLGRHLFVIGESDSNDPRLILPREIGGYGIDAQWSSDFHHIVHVLLTGEREGYYIDYEGIDELSKALQWSFIYDDEYSRFRQRRFGRRPIGVSGHQFVTFLQNHDQIGNRARGERIAQTADERRQMVGAGLLLASPFVPLIFQGEEWAATAPFQFFTDYRDEKTGSRVREGRQKEFAAFGWSPEDIPDPQSEETFKRSKLDWSELATEPHRSMLNWYRDLIQLRRNSDELSDGRMDNVRTRFVAGKLWLVMERGETTVLVNVGEERETLPLRPGRPNRILLASDTDVELDDNRAELPAMSIVFLGS